MYGHLLYEHRLKHDWTIDEFRVAIAQESKKILQQTSTKPVTVKTPSKGVISQYERGLSVPKADMAIYIAIALRDSKVISKHPRANEHMGRWLEWAQKHMGQYGELRPEWEVVLVGCVEYVYSMKGQDVDETLCIRVYDLWASVIASRTFRDIYTQPWTVDDGQWIHHAIELVSRLPGAFVDLHAKFLFIRGLLNRLKLNHHEALHDFAASETMFESSPVRSQRKHYWLIDLQIHKALSCLHVGHDIEAYEAQARMRRLCTTKEQRDGVMPYYLYGLSLYHLFRMEYRHAIKAATIAAKYIQRIHNAGRLHAEDGELNVAFMMVYAGIESADYNAIRTGMKGIINCCDSNSPKARTFYWRAAALIYAVTRAHFEDLHRAIHLSSDYDTYRTFSRKEELYAKWYFMMGEDEKATSWLERYSETNPTPIVRLNLHTIKRHSYYWQKKYTIHSPVLDTYRLRSLLDRETTYVTAK